MGTHPKLIETDDIKEAKDRASVANAEAIQKKIRSYLSGEIKSDNEVITYLIAQVALVQAKINESSPRMRAAQEQIKRLQADELMLHGAMAKTLDDLAHWISKEDKPC